MKRFLKNPKIILASFVTACALLAVGFLAGASYGYLVNPPAQIEVLGKTNTQEVDFSLFWQVWDTLTSKYLFSNKLEAQELVWGAITGMVQAAGDPYTSFLTPKNNETVKESLNGTYEGIGAELGMDGDQLIVVAPLDGSPAKEAGLKPQDKILKVDGAMTAGITIIEAVSKIRGEAGTKVVLTLQRDGGDPFDMDIVRNTISVPSVVLKICNETECSEDGVANPKVAYIRISRFGDDTNKLWDEVTASKELQSFSKIIVDVRGNPGGYLLSPVHIASDFLKKGSNVLWQEDARGFQRPLKTSKEPRFEKAQV
ncbi:MAG: PDZ domain-containing protein, partial [bacterium]